MPSTKSAPGEDDEAVSIKLAINFKGCEIEERDERVPSLSSSPAVSEFDFEGF